MGPGVKWTQCMDNQSDIVCRGKLANAFFTVSNERSQLFGLVNWQKAREEGEAFSSEFQMGSSEMFTFLLFSFFSETENGPNANPNVYFMRFLIAQKKKEDKLLNI